MSVDKLSCEEVIEQLFTYLDGELTHDHAIAIDRHLERCRDCFSRAEFEKRLRARIRDSAKARGARAPASQDSGPP
jgi:anti-sigma factor (TIGR02949 family)